MKVKMVKDSCYFCGADLFSCLGKIRNFTIIKCDGCGLICTNVGDSKNKAKRFKELSNQGQLHEYQKFYLPRRVVSYNKILDEIDPWKKLNKILDIGCGYGYFLAEAEKRGWRPYGIEISSYKVDFAKDKLGLNRLKGRIEEAGFKEHQEGFDVVTMWDVLEHIPNPLDVLKFCNKVLRREGLLVLKVPNGDVFNPNYRWLLRQFVYIYQRLVFPANPYEHLYHFSPAILTRILEKAGFQLIRLMTEDSFNERVIAGRNWVIRLIRRALMYLGWKLNLPFEMVMFAKRKG